METSAPQDVGSLLPLDEQIVDISIPQCAEEIIEDQIFDALVPQTVEEQFVAVTPTPVITDATFPHENLMKLARSWPRNRLISVRGQACVANLVSDAKQVYGSNKVTIGNMLREIDALEALGPRAAAERLNEEMSSSTPPIVRRAKKGRYKK